MQTRARPAVVQTVLLCAACAARRPPFVGLGIALVELSPLWGRREALLTAATMRARRRPDHPAADGDWMCRRMYVEDLDAICELDKRSYGGKGLWTQDMYRTDIRSANDEVIGITAADSSNGSSAHATRRLVGLASMSLVLDEAGITSMAVSPDMRGQGLGEGLMLGLMLIASSRAIASFSLEVRADTNAPAVALYRKFGFSDAGRRKGYYKNPDEDALILTRAAVSPEELDAWVRRLRSAVSFSALE